MFDVRWVLILVLVLTACGDDTATSDAQATTTSVCEDPARSIDGPICVPSIGTLRFFGGTAAEHIVDIQAWSNGQVTISGWTSRSDAYTLEFSREDSDEWTVIGTQGGEIVLHSQTREIDHSTFVYGPSVTLAAGERGRIRLSYDGTPIPRPCDLKTSNSFRVGQTAGSGCVEFGVFIEHDGVGNIPLSPQSRWMITVVQGLE